MSDNRTRIWFSLFVLAVFCVGLAAGLAVGRRIGPPLPPAGLFGQGGPRDRPPELGPRGGPGSGQLLDRLDRELQLTADQKARVQAILDARRTKLEAVHREIIARAEKEHRELDGEIRAVLTPEQQQRFDRWLEQQPRGRRGRGF